MSVECKKSINISPHLYERLQKIADEHDIVSHTETPKVTTARAILQLFCTLDKLHGVQKLKENENLKLNEIIRQGVINAQKGVDGNVQEIYIRLMQ